jgi:molecular chaperone GrpE
MTDSTENTPTDAIPLTDEEAFSAPVSDATGSPTAEATAINDLDKQLADSKDKYLRLAAEYDNFRKRSVRERQEAEQKGMGNLIRGILDALDDLGRFAHVDPETVDSKTVVTGAEMVEKKLLKSLAGHGLEVVDPLDHPFNPAIHEAITTVPAVSEAEDHRVAQVFQVGYVFNGILLRPARVVVKQWNG